MIDDHNRCEWVNVSSGTGSLRLSRTESSEPWNSCSRSMTAFVVLGFVLSLAMMMFLN